MKFKDEKGMVTLEACVSVMIFMILMFTILGLFEMFMAQNQIAHCMIQTAQSLALDAYATENLKVTDDTKSIGTFATDALTEFFGNAEESPNFVTDDKWYDVPAKVSETVKKRFIGYISGGDEEAADKFLKSVNVADGLEGLDFSKSEVVNGDLRAVVEYELEYSFQLPGLSNVPVEQKAVSKLWK